MDTAIALQPGAANSLQAWHRMIAERDLSRLPELLHPQAVFRSPMAHKPYEGAAAMNLILNTVLQVFEDFRYTVNWPAPRAWMWSSSSAPGWAIVSSRAST